VYIFPRVGSVTEGAFSLCAVIISFLTTMGADRLSCSLLVCPCRYLQPHGGMQCLCVCITLSIQVFVEL
jgi:hypothetical protein